MKTKINISMLLLFLAFTFNSCIYDLVEVGNGEVIEESRTIPDFSGISLSSNFKVFYEYADSNAVKVVAESNLIPFIETAVFNNELKIRQAYHVNIRPQHTIEVYITGPYVDKLKVSSSGTLVSGPIENDLLEISLSGSGDIETEFYGDELITNLSSNGSIKVYAETLYTETKVSSSGRTYLEGFSKDAEFKLSSSGKIRAYDYPVEKAKVTISSSGDVYCNVRDFIDVTISSSGDLHFIGEPDIYSNITGSGDVIDEN